MIFGKQLVKSGLSNLREPRAAHTCQLSHIKGGPLSAKVLRNYEVIKQLLKLAIFAKNRMNIRKRF